MKRARDFRRILIFKGPMDMRKQSNGLAEVVEDIMKENPFEDCLFLFCNRKRDIIKGLYFDKAGFCLWTKKLDQSKFPWLKEGRKYGIELSYRDVDLILDGVNIFTRHKNLKFQSIS